MLLVSSLVYAVSQTVDGRVYYDNGSLAEVGSGFPVLWYYEDHDTYSYTTTGPIYAYKWNSTSYFGFHKFNGNNSQWQTLWACNESNYGMIRYRLDANDRCLAATIPRCHDIVINMSVLDHPILDSDGDGVCHYFDDTASAPDPYSCFGVPDNDESVCSGRGDCTNTDTCFCADNYIGVDCADFNCYIYDSESSIACKGNGECVAPNDCVCDTGWTGYNCGTREPMCFGLYASEDGVCSDHGTCVADDDCECYDGYTGDECSVPPVVTCFGIPFDNAGVCSGRGMCVAIDDCECPEDWTGDECEEEDIYISDWEVMFTNRLSTYIGDTFHAGVSTFATDGYDFGVDLPQLGLPSDAKAVQMRTLVDGHRLTKDYRSIDLPKIWEIKKLVQGIEEDEQINAIDTITWNYTGVPANITLTLVDYGMDSSRTTVVESIDLKVNDFYSFNVIKTGPGTFRYIDFIAGSYVDNDGDGFAGDVDCDDTNISIYPGAIEVCNLVDDNCDSSIDEGFICPQIDYVAYYSFDVDFRDDSGNGFDGVPNGDVYIDPVEGINGTAVFDGNGDFINISRVLNTKSFTVSGWVQSDSLNDYESIFDIGNEDNHIGITQDRPGFFFWWGSISKTGTIDNQWYYITWIYDEIGNHWKVYVDGEHFAHVYGTWGGLDASLGTGSQYWGAFYNGVLNKYFGGKLDEMTIHNRVLSEQEILDLCNSGEGLGSCFNTVEITQGWNLLSVPIIPTTNDEDRTISLKAGWNMFGHLSQNPFLWSDAKVSDGVVTKTISEAQSLGWLQETIYYFDEGSQVYKFIPGDEDSLTVNKGYWLYAVKDNLELIFPKVGGALEDNAYNWLDAEVSNGITTKTISEAQALGWLQGTIYYFDEDSQTYKFVPGDDDNVYPDRGYWLYSKENLSLVIS
jgi:hypothetical protein